eukprot:2520836-Pyramimonas_sp.AAC.1
MRTRGKEARALEGHLEGGGGGRPPLVHLPSVLVEQGIECSQLYDEDARQGGKGLGGPSRGPSRGPWRRPPSSCSPVERAF